MRTKHLILALLALLTSITASASISSQNFWTDSNGTTWCFETDGSNARLIPEEDPEDFYPCADGELSDLTIPSIVYVGQIAYTVSAIGARAFEDDSYTTSVIIPETVTSIGGSAFYKCTSLTTISIPSSVTSIGEEIFAGCSSLISVRLNIETPPSVENWFYEYSPPSRKATLYVPYGSKDAYEAAGYLTEFKEIIEMDPTPSSPIKFADANVRTICISNFDANGDGKFTFAEAAAVTTIGTVFMNNTSITSFDEFQYFTDVISIENHAFYGCSNLNSITLPENVTSIGEKAFRSCSNLTSLTIPDEVTSIGQAAFYLCSSLASVNIPDGVTTIEQAVFGGCQVLESITIPNDVTSIGVDAFYNCRILTTITLPEGVTTIGQSAFYNCFALTTINIPDGVTSITDHTFYNCQSLSSVIIPDDVTSIGEYAFNYCKSLTSVTIPKNVTSIGEGAFRYCSDLTMVRVDIATPISINEECFSNRANATLYVPNGCKAAYEAADYWNEFKEIIETNTVNVGSTGFATYCSPNAMDFSGVSGIKAYVASDFDSGTNTLTLTRVTEVPAEEGLYIVGTAGSYEIPKTTTDAVYSNLLKGVTTATTISPTDGDNTNFILANGSHGVGFYTLSAAGELAGGKAYLQLPTASVASVKAINVVFNDEETAIKDVEQSPNVQGIYNLQGQQVNAPRRGLYIINGKKVIIK